MMADVAGKLIAAIQSSAVFNPDVQVAPACILWPDRERQWEAIMPRLQKELPELLVLGDYSPEDRVGPAIWLRCVIGTACTDIGLPDDKTPIFYLPGVSRQDLRAVQDCPDHLKPLAELQYRGTIWSQLNSKDWTILAFMSSAQGGLGLDVAQDNESKNAMQVSLHQFLDEDSQLLQGRRLDKDYFNTLLSGDPVRELLQWLDQDDIFRSGRDENEWRAFVALCKSQLGFDPENDGILAGAEKLVRHEGPWLPVWSRFCEAPKRYPNIPGHIRKCTMPMVELFSDAQSHGSWPQWNESQEKQLRDEYLKFSKLSPHKAREQLLSCESRHGARRDLIWAELGESSLAMAAKYLAILAEYTAKPLAAGSVADMEAGYCQSGWLADDSMLKALACVDRVDDIQAVTAAIRSVYQSWLDDSARHLQQMVEQEGYPSGICPEKSRAGKEGECILFVDGLRFDLAKRLSNLLSEKGHSPDEKLIWAALPSVTATGKPAVSPIRELIVGQETTDFEPCVAASGKSLKGGYYFKKMLEFAGWQILGKAETGDSKGLAWCEFGDIDHEGHERGWKLAKHVDGLLLEIARRVQQLHKAGWQTIRIVTDHGWLLLPSGLPKVELPKLLVDNKWGRCAALKEGAVSSERVFPWYWNPEQSFALADGICCYKKGEEYTHGGLSLQECLTLQLTTTQESRSGNGLIEITDVVWKGLRCKVAVDGDFTQFSLDVRRQAGNESSSVVMSLKPINESGMASVVIEDEDLEGSDAHVVVLDSHGQLVSQVATIIGGNM